MCKYEMIVSVGDEVVFIFKFNCSSEICSVILKNLPSELPLNFLGFINNYPARRPAACKKFLQSQLGYGTTSGQKAVKKRDHYYPGLLRCL